MPTFKRSASDGDYRLVNDGRGRLPAALIGDANTDTAAAVVIPLDADLASRAEAAMRLWRVVACRPADRLTRQLHHRLGLALRALDGRLAGESYPVIAASLFGSSRVPAGPWRKTHDSRDRTIRLTRAGLELMQGRYLDLLRYPGPQRE
jgi:hypothetical protein